MRHFRRMKALPLKHLSGSKSSNENQLYVLNQFIVFLSSCSFIQRSMDGKLLDSSGLGFDCAKGFGDTIGRQFARNGQKSVGGVICAKFCHL